MSHLHSEQNCKHHWQHLPARAPGHCAGHKQHISTRNTEHQRRNYFLLEQFKGIMELFVLLRGLAFIQSSQTLVLWVTSLSHKRWSRATRFNSCFSPEVPAATVAHQAQPHISYRQQKTYRHQWGSWCTTMKILCISAAITIKVIFKGEGTGNTLGIESNQFFPPFCWHFELQPTV